MRQVVHNITIFSKYFYSTSDPSPFLYFEERKVGVTFSVFSNIIINDKYSMFWKTMFIAVDFELKFTMTFTK